MTIRKKTWLLTVAAVVILAGALVLIARQVIIEGFARLEQDFARRNLARSVNVLTQSLEELSRSTGDYAWWDNTYAFINDPSDVAYREENFLASSFANIHVHCMLFFDTRQRLACSQCFENAEAEGSVAPAELVEAVRAVPGLLSLPDTSHGRYGILLVNRVPHLVAAQPILANDRKGPGRGCLVFMRKLDSAETTRLSAIMGLPLSFALVDTISSGGHAAPIVAALRAGERNAIHAVNRHTLHAHTLIPDIAGRPALLLTVESDRAIYARGRRTYLYALAWFGAVSTVFALLVLLMLELGVLGRLGWLRRVIDDVKRSPEPSRRIAAEGRDEITALAGDINGMLAAIQQAQTRADESEQRYSLLFAQMLNAFALHELVLDDHGKAHDYRFLEINPAFERMTGLTRAQAIGRTVRELLPTVEPQWIERYARVVQTGEPAHFEDFNKSLGKHFEVLAFKAGGNRFGVTFTDITERKRAEEERERAEEQVAQLQKMEAIGQLAGGIAHDFNNQMAGVLGYAEMIRERVTTDPKLSRFANNIIVGIRRAADLTAQLLAFARKGKYLTVPVNIHSVILEVVTLLEHSLDKRITIRQHLNARSPVTTGDPTQLQNVVLNMALNARDAMPEGGELTFATETVTLDEDFCRRHPHEVLPGTYLRVSVTDTGVGMDPETMKHVFEPFFTTKQPGKGTGMGLAAAYGTVKNHHGAITVYSELGHGSTFNVYLPLAEAPAPSAAEEKPIRRIPGKPHIMVVDDEPLVAEMAVDLLGELGCEVTHFDGGKEALEHYERSWRGVDLVLLDIVMPDMNGCETFRRLKAINPEVKVLLSSGYSMNGEMERTLKEGALGFVQKPYHRNELAQAILRVLGAENADRA